MIRIPSNNAPAQRYTPLLTQLKKKKGLGFSLFIAIIHLDCFSGTRTVTQSIQSAVLFHESSVHHSCWSRIMASKRKASDDKSHKSPNHKKAKIDTLVGLDSNATMAQLLNEESLDQAQVAANHFGETLHRQTSRVTEQPSRKLSEHNQATEQKSDTSGNKRKLEGDGVHDSPVSKKARIESSAKPRTSSTTQAQSGMPHDPPGQDHAYCPASSALASDAATSLTGSSTNKDNSKVCDACGITKKRKTSHDTETFTASASKKTKVDSVAVSPVTGTARYTAQYSLKYCTESSKEGTTQDGRQRIDLDASSRKSPSSSPARCDFTQDTTLPRSPKTFLSGTGSSHDRYRKHLRAYKPPACGTGTGAYTASRAKTGCKNLSFLDMPDEWRQKIYSTSLTHDSVNEKYANLPLLLVCKQVHAEAQPVFEAQSTASIVACLNSYKPGRGPVESNVIVAGAANFACGAHFDHKRPTTYRTFPIRLWPKGILKCKSITFTMFCDDDKLVGTVQEDFHAVNHLLASFNSFLRSGSRCPGQELKLQFVWHSRSKGYPDPHTIATSGIPRRILKSVNVLHPVSMFPSDLKLQLLGLPDDMRNPILKARNLQGRRLHIIQHDVISEWLATRDRMFDGGICNDRVKYLNSKHPANLKIHNRLPDQQVTKVFLDDLIREFRRFDELELHCLRDPSMIVLPTHHHSMSKILKAVRRVFRWH